MTSRVIIISLIGILIVGFHDCLSQDFKSGQELQNLNDKEKIQHLQSNFNAMSLALIKYAKDNENSVSDAGVWTGELFAQSWGENVTPEDFVKSMNNNWQMFDIKT